MKNPSDFGVTSSEQFLCPIIGGDLIGPESLNDEGTDMRSRFTDLSTKELLSLLLPYVALLIIGVVGRASYQYEWPMHDLAHALFDACAVAGILAIAVELSSARRLIRHVSDELASKLIGRGLPHSLQSKIADIVRTDLVRERHVKRFRVGEPTDGQVGLEITYEYTVRNYSRGAVGYAPFIGEEIFYKPKFLSLVYCLHSAGREDVVHAFKEDKLAESHVKPDGISQALLVTDLPQVIVPALADDSEACCTVAWRYHLTMPDEYSDITSFGGASIGLTVHLDKLPSGFSFDVTGPGINRSDDGQFWSTNQSFLPGQHVRARWFRQS